MRAYRPDIEQQPECIRHRRGRARWIKLGERAGQSSVSASPAFEQSSRRAPGRNDDLRRQTLASPALGGADRKLRLALDSHHDRGSALKRVMNLAGRFEVTTTIGGWGALLVPSREVTGNPQHSGETPQASSVRSSSSIQQHRLRPGWRRADP